MKVYTKSQINEINKRIDILEQRIVDQKVYLYKEQNNLPHSTSYILEEMTDGINRDISVLRTMLKR